MMADLIGDAPVADAGRENALLVAEHGTDPRLVVSRERDDAIAEPVDDDAARSRANAIGRVAREPAIVLALQVRRQVPVIQRGVREDVALEQSVDEPVVEVEASRRSRRRAVGCTRGHAIEKRYARTPRPAIRSRSASSRLIMIARDIAIRAVGDRAGLPAELVPDRRSTAVAAAGAFDLERAGGDAPDEIARESGDSMRRESGLVIAGRMSILLVDSRTISSTGGSATRGVRPPSSCSIACAELWPSDRTDWRTVVSGGNRYSDDGRSSKPDDRDVLRHAQAAAIQREARAVRGLVVDAEQRRELTPGFEQAQRAEQAALLVEITFNDQLRIEGDARLRECLAIAGETLDRVWMVGDTGDERDAAMAELDQVPRGERRAALVFDRQAAGAGRLQTPASDHDRHVASRSRAIASSLRHPAKMMMPSTRRAMNSDMQRISSSSFQLPLMNSAA